MSNVTHKKKTERQTSLTAIEKELITYFSSLPQTPIYMLTVV